MNKFKFSNIISYLLILGGFIIAIFIIYNKFIRERLPKEIPLFLTEKYFWILLYLCCLYMYVIKNLLKPSEKKSDEAKKLLIEFFFMPLTAFDHFIKYNKYFKENYYIFMDNVLLLLNKCSIFSLKLIIFLFQIIPRIFLVGFLIRDVFYFETIEIFYKYLIIGLIPFIHRYIKYSIKNLIDYYISELEVKYDYINMWDSAYTDPSINWESTEENKYHQKDVPIKEYVNYETKQHFYKSSVKYDSYAIVKDTIYEQYTKYNKIEGKLTDNDQKIMDKEYNYYMPKIINFNVLLEKYAIINNTLIIRIFKIVIFGGYLICWGYVLTVSFYTYPLTFENTINVLQNMSYRINEPFSNLNLYEK